LGSDPFLATSFTSSLQKFIIRDAWKILLVHLMPCHNFTTSCRGSAFTCTNSRKHYHAFEHMCANPTLQQVATVDALMVKSPISLGDLNPTIYLA
jgi:hypothetical protein